MTPYPIFVTVPVSGWHKSIDERNAQVGAPLEYADMVIGCLPDWKVAGPNDIEAAERDIGKPILSFSSQVKCKDGFVAVVVALAVRCETIEEAIALPSFVHLFAFTGTYALSQKQDGKEG